MPVVRTTNPRPLLGKPEMLQRGIEEGKGFKPVGVPRDPAEASRLRVRMTRNVTNVYRDAPAQTVQQGRDWYPKAHDEAVTLGRTLGADTRTGAGIIAALSPSMAWENNVPAAHQMAHVSDRDLSAMAAANDVQKGVASRIAAQERAAARQQGMRGSAARLAGSADPDLYVQHEHARQQHMATRRFLVGTPLNNQSTDNILKAANIRAGQTPESQLPMRIKTGQFFTNVNDPSDPHAVTVDTHAHDAARMSKLPFKTDRALTAVSRYEHFAAAYRNAAPRVGATHAHVVQAVVWQHWKNRYGNDL